MSREQVLACIQNIQELFPTEFIEHMWLNLVSASNLDELLARSLSVFSPVFLPVFERDGDIYAIHLQPKVSWQQSAWVYLPHDAAEPVLVASRLQYLPSGIIVPYLPTDRVEAIWDSLQSLVDCIPGATMPEKEPLLDPDAEIAFLRTHLDPLDGAARIANAISRPTPKEQVPERVEAIMQELPDDTLTLAATALLRAEIGYADPLMPALKVITSEVFLGFRYVNRWIVADSASELLELIRPIAMPGIDEESPLALLKAFSFNEPETASVLLEVATQFRNLGDEEQALNQLRNGATLAGIDGNLDATWCNALAEEAQRVEPDCLAASLASLAAEVIHLGP